MTFDPTSIGKAHSNLPPRIVLSGEPKAGKTTWAAKAPSPLFIPIVGEEGCDDLVDSQGNSIDVDAVPTIQNYQELISVLEWFRDGEHSFKTLIIDSLSSAERMIWNDLVESDSKADSIELVGGGYGKGYTMTLERFRRVTQLISEIREKRKACAILIAHVTPKMGTDAETLEQYDAYELALNKKVVALFEQWTDYMLFASKTKYRTEEGKAIDRGRKLILHGKAHLPVGGRSIISKLPAELPLEWQAFQDAVKAAKQQTKKED